MELKWLCGGSILTKVHPDQFDVPYHTLSSTTSKLQPFEPVSLCVAFAIETQTIYTTHQTSFTMLHFELQTT